MQPHEVNPPAAAPEAPRPRRPLVLTIGLALAALAAAGAWLLIPTRLHTVRTMVQVPPGSYLGLKTGEPAPDIASHQRTQVALAKSRLVLNSALRDPAVQNLPLIINQLEPIQWLEKEIQICLLYTSDAADE